MDGPVINVINTYQLEAGRRLTAYEKTRKEASALGLTAIVAALDRQIEHDSALYAAEQRWRQRRSQTAEHAEEARDLDARMDSLIAGLESSLRAQTRMASVYPSRAAEAERMLAALFPEGLAAVVQVTYVDQSHRTRLLIDAIRRDAGFQRLLRSLSLTELVDEIARLNEEYAAAVGGGARLSREQLDEQRRVGLEGFGEVIARIIGRFPTESEDDKAKRARLLAPIGWQNAVIREQYRERNRGPSGEEATELMMPQVAEDPA